uniref:DNA damage-binding protein 1 n=1 Tax=Strongyloides papillosus TaxID=174720 RepID=A0A0N5BUB1_STREA
MNKEEIDKTKLRKKVFSLGRSQEKERFRRQNKECIDDNTGRSKSVTFLNSKINSKESEDNKEPKIYKARSAIKSLNSLIVAVERSRIKTFEKDFCQKRQNSFESSSDTDNSICKINIEILRKLRCLDLTWLNTANQYNPEIFVNLRQSKNYQRADYDKTTITTITCKNKPRNKIDNDIETILGFTNAFYIIDEDDDIKILVQVGEDTLRIYKSFFNEKNFSIADIKDGNESAFIDTNYNTTHDSTILKEIKLGTYTITSIDQSPDGSILAIAITSESSGSSIIIKKTQTLDDICVIGLTNICCQVKLSHHNENVCSLSRLIIYEKNEIDKILLNITIYSIQFSMLLIDTCNFDENDVGEFIDMSFCPVDESILFLLTMKGAYFLRIQNNILSILSSIELISIETHSWVSDTYVAFGSNDGILYLYRETTPLKIINIKAIECDILQPYLLNDDSKVIEIKYITSNIYNIVVYLQIGIILIFDNTHDIEKIFEKCKIIVINDRSNDLLDNNLIKSHKCLGIKLDYNASNMLFMNKKAIYTTNILYGNVIGEKEMRIIVGQNCAPISNLEIMEINKNSRREILVSLDCGCNLVCTELYSKQILSLKKFSSHEIIGFCTFKFGYQILIATTEGVFVYDLIYLDIKRREEQKILDGKASTIVSNHNKTYAAIIIESLLYIVNLYTLNILCNCNLSLKNQKNSKFDIVCCKWSDNKNLNSFEPSSLAILTKNENLIFIEGNCGKILWFTSTKLKFFIDICVGNDEIVYGLNKKYLITCYKEGKEFKTISVPTYHSVGIHVTTNFIEILDNDLYIGDNMGVINILFIQTNSDEKFIKRKVIRGIKYNYTGGTDDKNKQIFMSCMKIDKISNILLLGFNNGYVLKILLEDKNLLQSNSYNKETMINYHSKGLILYPISKIQNLQDLVSHLAFERNSILKGSSKILEEYMELKEKELISTTNLLNETTFNFKEKIKICEKEYTNKLEDKEEIIGILRKEHKTEIDSTKNFYENMINDHLRQVIKMKNDYSEEINNIKNSYEKKINDSKREINELNSQYELKLNKVKDEKSILEEKIKYLDAEVFDLCKRIDQTEQKMEKQIQQEKTEKLRLKENFEKSIKDIKANLVILNDEKDTLLDTASMGRMEIQLLKEEIMEKDEKINEYEVILCDLERELEGKNKLLQEKIKSVGLLKGKINLLEKEVQNIKKDRNIVEKHMIEFETKIEEMSRNVYDERKLQHNALSLIGIYNSSKPKSLKTKLNLMKN